MSSQGQGGKRRRNVALFTAAFSAAAAVAVALEFTDATTAHVPIIGEYTGELSRDGPVYRLPPVHVVADRDAALARTERVGQLERAPGAQANTARKPNV
jgi:hypothetical protein